MKLLISNMSVVFVKQYGGSGFDFGGLCMYSFDGSAGLPGLALSPEDGIAATFFVTDSPNIPTVTVPSGSRVLAVALFSTNGTFVKYVSDFV